MDLTINCAQRASDEKTKKLRREGTLPAVLYGHDGTASVSLKVSNYDAEALLRKATINKSVITINVPDMPWSGKVILREVQKHPWKNKLHHLSFFSIASQEFIEVSMPINFVGEAIGVTDKGGTLDMVLTEVQLKCPPNAIPQSLDVDISGLDIGDALHVGEIALPEGSSIAADDKLLVVSVLAPRTASSDDEGGAAASEGAAGETAAAS
ncbi:MAG: LSU ribosomal protein L25 RplY [Phormidesmis priestleyi Ana]|uniref:Large ribosomal subunit protein bL25 n=1 Tax=Phormidesmis priestleyi Ana TaxID=1666911 RepID=A0A0P7Z2C7_9CYAN|nr:MAG: LSU ribosomal protein L25 RplY [Phormidesmis priestleyi Ana]